MLLNNKIVLISGIGPGLGVKLAIEAAREGAAGVVIAARSADKLDDAEQRIAALKTRCAVLKCVTDITDRAQCERLATAAIQQFGRIDALVNSAYFHGDMDYASTANLDSWAAVMDTNLIGTLKLTQAVIPQMKAQRSGAIVNINTMAARVVPPLGEAGYAASKGAGSRLQVPRQGAGTGRHPRQQRPHGLDVGRAGRGIHAVAGEGIRRADREPGRADRLADSDRPHPARRGMRTGGAVHGVRLRQRDHRRDAGRQWRALHGVARNDEPSR
jgi:hypothetical protein